MTFALRTGRVGSLVALAAVALALGLSACSRSQPAPVSKAAAAEIAAAAESVYTSFYPTEYFGLRIAGGKVRVVCPVPADADPIFWRPTTQQVQFYQAAGLIVLNGAAYEKWPSTVSLPLSKVVDTAKPFAAEFVKFKTTTHSHGAAGAHSHEGVDGHTWMDPINAKLQAEQMMLAMARRWPVHEQAFGEGYRGLASDLDALDARFKALQGDVAKVRLLASHPAYNYIAKRYGWSIENIDLPPDEPPTTAQQEALKAALAKGAAGSRFVMLFEAAPLAETAGMLAKLGVAPCEFNPCETLDEDERAKGADYLTVMRANLDRLQGVVQDVANASSPSDASPPKPAAPTMGG